MMQANQFSLHAKSLGNGIGNWRGSVRYGREIPSVPL